MILLIEDDLVTCHIMTALLKRLRHPHVVAHNGADALELVGRQPTDLIICDLMLPDVPGLELVERILVRPHLQDIPVMFCTANADAKTVERALALGCVDFVKKPIVVDAFAQRIERALKRAPARWESWREMIKRLRVDSRTFQPLLALARDHWPSSCSSSGGCRRGAPRSTRWGATSCRRACSRCAARRSTWAPSAPCSSSTSSGRGA
jgi:CheY-like chemotaxis protein